MKKILILLSAVLICSTAVQAQDLKVKYGPWVTATDENSFTVLWVTETPGKAWVELSDGTRHYHEFAGRRIFERLHTVKVDGLEKGKSYSYKLGCAPVEDDTNPYDPTFRAEQVSGTYSTKTFDYNASTCRFTVVNDMHMEVDKYRNLIRQTKPRQLDFIHLNGDIVSAGNYILDTMAHYDFDALKGYCESVPVTFARGNHESRGNNTKLMAELFPSNTGNLYYAFRQGPAAFFVLDAGETAPERCLEYAGTLVYEKYLNEQIVWLKQTVKDPIYADAPIKICMLHVPMITIPDDVCPHKWMNKNILPVLNEEGFNLMIAGDLHEFIFNDTGSCGNNFPIIVNSDHSRVEVKATCNGYDLKIYEEDGKVSFSHSYKL